MTAIEHPIHHLTYKDNLFVANRLANSVAVGRHFFDLETARSVFEHFREEAGAHAVWLPLPLNGLAVRTPGALLVGDPAMAAELMTHDLSDITKGAEQEAVRALMGKTSLFGNGAKDSWQVMRAANAKDFNIGAVHERYAHTLNRVVDERLAELAQKGEIPNIYRAFAEIAVDLTLRTLLNFEATPAELKQLVDEHERSVDLFMVRPFIGLYPKQDPKSMTERVISRIVAQEMQEPSLIFQHLNQAGLAQSPAEMADTIRTYIVAGTSTSATSMTSIMLLLNQHPEVKDRVRAALQSNRTGNHIPTLSEIERTPEIKQTMKESARLMPTGLYLIRKAMKELSIDGQTIPDQSLIVFLLCSIGYDKTVWENPERFDPWRPNIVNSRLDKLFSFGIGKRSCQGRNFAEANLQTLLAACLSNYDIIIPNAHQYRPIVGNSVSRFIPSQIKAFVSNTI